MQIFAQSFWLPKHGSSTTEYEDAFWPLAPVDGLLTNDFHCAVADGATEASYSRIWAMLLVRTLCRRLLFDPTSLNQYLPDIQRRWLRLVRRRFRGKTVPWFVEEKIESGAYAALLGLYLAHEYPNSDRGKWLATAIGDCCLVQMRGEQIVVAFPIAVSEAFNNRPYLLSSKPAASESIADKLELQAGSWRVEDTFYLMSDALAQWFLREHEQGNAPWSVLRDLNTRDAAYSFPDWIAELRSRQAIRNDDVTLLRLNIV
jgi:hypothetical protein